MTSVTGAPSSFHAAAGADTLEQIEFRQALDIVAQHAVSTCGAERVRARRPSAAFDYVQRELHLVGALVRVFDGGGRFRPFAPPDVREALTTLRVPGSVLDGSALVQLAQAYDAMRGTVGELQRVGNDEPLLSDLIVDPPPAAIVQRMNRALDPDGVVKDEASPELRKARRSVRETRTRLVKHLEARLRDLGSDASPEVNVTMRGGRYVIPVRRETKGRVGGIVHGESASGATLFVEPSDIVDTGNELAAAEAAESRAVQQVLRELTDLARSVLDAAEAGWEMCITVDDVYARARYVVEIGAAVPMIRPAPGPLVLNDVKHPILLAESDTVVPFDLETDAEHRVLVVSGPNTGGKTVLLKAVGLVSSLIQSGVVPPVGAKSSIPVFSRIFADIGDHQSIAASLSTYSGHLEALKRILDSVDDQALILLDEFGTGTDPVEGAALAGAVLKTLCARGSIAMATTHLGQIKQLAVETPGAINASLQFDPDQLAPTYRFLTGVPGRSYGLAIAQRLGFPKDVLDAAEQLLPQGERSLDALLADLEQREHELANREVEVETLQARVAAEGDGLEALKAELAQRASDLDAERRHLETTGRAEARRFLLEARKRVEDALGVARAAVTEATAKEARRLVEEGVRDEGDALKRLQAEAEKKGWTVRTSGGKARGGASVVDREPTDVATRRLKPNPRKRRRTAAAEPAPSPTEIDLRGMTGDEAEGFLLRAIDEAVVEDLGTLRIIHGKGTGALRQRVGEVLARDRRVMGSRQGSPAEGGWGVTVVEIAR